MQDRNSRTARKRRTTPLVAIATATSLVLIAGCSSAAPSDDAAAHTGLERFEGQELVFGTCDAAIVDSQPPVPEVIDVATTADCATLKVPLDYENPAEESIDIAVSRISATGQNRIGSVVVNPGGPGFAATTFAPLQAALWEGGPITERFDVVGFDPRGVGLSRPAIDCYPDEERDSEPPVSALGGWTEESARAIVDTCAAGSGGEQILAHIGTRDVARDMDILRSALGDDQLTFAGTSYGTRLGAVYAEMFPENVRALVLDAVLDPTKNTRERRLEGNAAMQGAFEQLATFCAEQGACPLGDDPEQATAQMQQLLRHVEENPVQLEDGRTVQALTITEGIVAGLYSEATWPTIIAGLAELHDGRVDTLVGLRDSYYGRSETGTYSNDIEATFAINCLDEELLTAEQTTQLGRDLTSAAPFLDFGSDPTTRHGCEYWPAEPTLDFPYAENIEGLPPVLVTSATGDPITPHDGAITLAENLGARLLTVDGTQHGLISSGNACVDDIVANYLVALELPEDDARCTL